jgi:hypothetical protein
MDADVEEEEEEAAPHLHHDDGFAGSVFDSEYDAGAVAAAAEEAAEWEPAEAVKLGRVVGTWREVWRVVCWGGVGLQGACASGSSATLYVGHLLCV